jgi:hypothetical protein
MYKMTRCTNSPLLLPQFLFTDERNLSLAGQVVQPAIDIYRATVLSRVRGVATIVIGLVSAGPPVEACRIQWLIWKQIARQQAVN